MNKIILLYAALFASEVFAGEPFPVFSAPRAITSGPHEHLFASYFGIDSWNASGRYATVLETDIKSRLSSKGEPATLGIVDMQDGERFIPLTETRCWNFQEGTMAHWLSEEKFVFNDLVDGKTVSVVYDIPSRSRKVLGMPVSAVSEDGRIAASINYSRLRATRREYGYDGDGQDARLGTAWPEDDGIWLMDMTTGESRLAVSIASQKNNMEAQDIPGTIAYFCHTKFNHDGTKLFWLARSIVVENGVQKGGWTTCSLVYDIPSGKVVRCFPDSWKGSHFNWLDNDRMCVTASYGGGNSWSHVFFTVGKQDWRKLGKGLLDFDGHAIFSPDGKYMVSDSYIHPFWHNRKLFALRMEDDAILPLGEFYVPPAYRGTAWRCDLHARYSRDGKRIGFNSCHEGSRQSYVIDVKQ